MVIKNHLSRLEEIVSLMAITLWHITETTDFANAPLKKLLFHTAKNELSVFMSKYEPLYSKESDKLYFRMAEYRR